MALGSRIKDIFIPNASGATANPGIRGRYVQLEEGVEMKMKSKGPNADLKRYINTKEESGSKRCRRTGRGSGLKELPKNQEKPQQETSNSEKANGKKNTSRRINTLRLQPIKHILLPLPLDKQNAPILGSTSVIPLTEQHFSINPQQHQHPRTNREQGRDKGTKNMHENEPPPCKVLCYWEGRSPGFVWIYEPQMQ